MSACVVIETAALNSPSFMTWGSKHLAQVRRPREERETWEGVGRLEVWTQVGSVSTNLHQLGGKGNSQGSRVIEEEDTGTTGPAQPLGAFVSTGLQPADPSVIHLQGFGTVAKVWV